MNRETMSLPMVALRGITILPDGMCGDGPSDY